MLLVDGANVVGTRPTGWWRDRARAARTLHEALRSAVGSGRLDSPVVLVLEGLARQGVPEGEEGGVLTVHAPDTGDDELVARAGPDDVVVTADRALRDRVTSRGSQVVGPRWLLDRLPG